MAARDIWAVVPVKGFSSAKQRLAGHYPQPFRMALARTMLFDVLACLVRVPELARVAVVTSDPEAAVFAEAIGATILAEEVRSGHTDAVNAAALRLAKRGCEGMLTLPGDIPAVTPDEVSQLIRSHGPARAFTIVPAHDGRGSNAIVMSPPDVLTLAFGNDSFAPHFAAASAAGLAPQVLRFAGIGLDIDEPEDLDRFARTPSETRTWAFLEAQRQAGGALSR